MEMSDLSRRDFLKLSATAAAVGLVVPQVLAADGAEAKSALEYRTLGRTGLKVTAVSIGCMQAPENAIAKAFDHGLNWFDTAHSYKQGKNEEEVGRVLAGDRRKNVYICTKIGPTTAAGLMEKIETSLKRLNTDHVDLLLAHGVSRRDVEEVNGKPRNDAVFNAEMMAGLEQAKKEGKTRFIGVSTHTNMADVLGFVVEAKVYDAVLTTYNYTADAKLKAAIAQAKQAGVGVIAMKTQAPVNSLMKEYAKQKAADPAAPEPKLPIPLNGLKMHEAALKWVLDDANISCAVPGATSLDFLDQNVAMMGRPITYFDRRRLEQVAEASRRAYCLGCSECADVCPQGVCIADVRRSLMYLQGYGDETLARAAYRELPVNAGACATCAGCAARCVRGVALQPVLREAHMRLA